MTTSAEIHETKLLLLELNQWRGWEQNTSDSLKELQDLYDGDPKREENEPYYQQMRRIYAVHTKSTLKSVASIKSRLALMPHVPNKAERRQARQRAAQGSSNRSRNR